MALPDLRPRPAPIVRFPHGAQGEGAPRRSNMGWRGHTARGAPSVEHGRRRDPEGRHGPRPRRELVERRPHLEQLPRRRTTPPAPPLLNRRGYGAAPEHRSLAFGSTTRSAVASSIQGTCANRPRDDARAGSRASRPSDPLCSKPVSVMKRRQRHGTRDTVQRRIADLAKGSAQRLTRSTDPLSAPRMYSRGTRRTRRSCRRSPRAARPAPPSAPPRRGARLPRCRVARLIAARLEEILPSACVIALRSSRRRCRALSSAEVTRQRSRPSRRRRSAVGWSL
jgi:hypothetical protein